MKGKLFVLKDVSDFAPGAFENTVVEGSNVELGRAGGSFLPSGCYTAPAFSCEGFRHLVPSWNADTPEGTTVETQARIAVDGQWSRWFSFGKWSPFIPRASSEDIEDELARVEGETLTVRQPDKAATMAQMRIYMYSNDAARTPTVQLLAAAVDGSDPTEEMREFVQRTLFIPAYACLVRDPAIGERIPSATSIAMMLNRWGEDVLPEEIARAGYDYEQGRFGNLSFLTAVAGSYGYQCYAEYGGVDALRAQVWGGNAVAARVAYRVPSFGEGDAEGTEAQRTLPVYEKAQANSPGHLVVVRGFEKRDGEEYVVVNDPLVEADNEVEQRLTITEFEAIYTGLALVMHKGAKGAGYAKPERMVTRVDAEGEHIRFLVHGVPLDEGNILPADVNMSTICYTVADGIAYASAAQKSFYYATLNDRGMLCVDMAKAAGRKLTFYVVGPLGATLVAEKQFDELPAQEKTAEEANT